jgi:hypothetical protein
MSRNKRGAEEYEDDDDNYGRRRRTIKFNDDSSFKADPRNLHPDLRRMDNPNLVDYMGYPPEYVEIYKEERDRRVYNKNDGVIRDVTDEKLYVPGNEQYVNLRIQQKTNKNCIKSREQGVLPHKNLEFSDCTKYFFEKEYGLILCDDIDDFSKGEISRRVKIFEDKILDENSNIIGPKIKDFNEFKLDKRILDRTRANRELFNEILEVKIYHINLQIHQRNVENIILLNHQNEIIEEENKIESEYINGYNEVLARCPTKFDALVLLIRYLAGPYRDNVCVAGGFSLAHYMSKNYNQEIMFKDVDIFFHSLYDEDSQGNALFTDQSIQNANQKANIIIFEMARRLKRIQIDYLMAKRNEITDPEYLKIFLSNNEFFKDYCVINNLGIVSDFNMFQIDAAFQHMFSAEPTAFIGENDNVINIGNKALDGLLSWGNFNFLTFQVIKRLYRSPSEIITGFDVDSCCILTDMNGRIHVTRRGEYAIKNAFNTINFEKLSPSYEYRLMKYNTRGFGIWVPFVDYFKELAYFNILALDPSRGSSIIIKKLLESKVNLTSERDVSDYSFQTNNPTIAKFQTTKEFYEDTFNGTTFKTLNPGEQVINTFHRLQLEDILLWYPRDISYISDHDNIKLTLPFSKENDIFKHYIKIIEKSFICTYINFDNFDDKKIIPIDPNIELKPLISKNIIKRYKHIKYNDINGKEKLRKHYSRILLDVIYNARNEFTNRFNIQGDRSLYVFGNTAKLALNGFYRNTLSRSKINLWTPEPMSDEEKKYLNHQITKYKTLIRLNTYIQNVNNGSDFYEQDLSYITIAYLDSLAKVVFPFQDMFQYLREQDDEGDFENDEEKFQHLNTKIKEIENRLLSIPDDVSINNFMTNEYETVVPIYNYYANSVDSFSELQLNDNEQFGFLVLNYDNEDVQKYLSMMQENTDRFQQFSFRRVNGGHMNNTTDHIITNNSNMSILKYIEKHENVDPTGGAVIYSDGSFYGIERQTALYINGVESLADVLPGPAHENYFVTEIQ